MTWSRRIVEEKRATYKVGARLDVPLGLLIIVLTLWNKPETVYTIVGIASGALFVGAGVFSVYALRALNARSGPRSPTVAARSRRGKE